MRAASICENARVLPNRAVVVLQNTNAIANHRPRPWRSANRASGTPATAYINANPPPIRIPSCASLSKTSALMAGSRIETIMRCP